MDTEVRFIENMGQHFERDGMPRIAGRIFGRLLLGEEPLNLEDLAAGLQVSRASVSTNTRLLETMGMIERLTYPGDRRDYYQVSETVSERMLEFRLARFKSTLTLLAEGLQTEAARSRRIRRRLRSFSMFFERMVEAITEARDAVSQASKDGN